MAKKLGRGSNRATPSSYNFGGSWSPSEIELARREARRTRNKRSALIAALSSFLVLGTLGLVLVTSPGWETLRNTFFKWAYGFEILPKILLGFTTNATLTVIAGTSVALLGLAIALLRTSRSAALTPFRILATLYVDVFRGIPMLLVILLVGFGIPALQIKGLTNNVLVLGTLAVIITYSAYVAEIFRAGIDSVHPSQRSAALSLGLSERQIMWDVILPQAVRNVVPSQMNMLIALQKDVSLLSFIGPVEIFRQAGVFKSLLANFTPYVGAAIIFLIITVPATRYADYLLARQSKERS